MAKLVIKGHNSRGKEVIEILKMLGGNTDTSTMLAGDLIRYGYYMNSDGVIDFKNRSSFDGIDIIYTLEEFLEKYPYKVGDKVFARITGCYGVFSIQEMKWYSTLNEVMYKIKNYWYTTNDLQPYKEENMEETNTIYHTTEVNFNHPVFEGCNEIEIIIPDGWEIKQRDNKMFGVRKQPQYPKTYKECCDVLGLSTMDNDAQGYKGDLIIRFQELIIARDAYWKIAGEQMGLDKPWEPDWTNEECPDMAYISYDGKSIDKEYGFPCCNMILIFPTTEMRDAFYENFKVLIEECKTFL